MDRHPAQDAEGPQRERIDLSERRYLSQATGYEGETYG